MRTVLQVVLAVMIGTRCFAGEVRVLCDFEKEPVATWAKFYENERSPLPAGHYCVRGRFTASQTGPATSGKWALTASFGPLGAEARYWPGVREGLHVTGRKAYILDCRGNREAAPPDWSGYDFLEFNAWKEKPGAMRLALVIEDRTISPPLLRRVTIEAEGQWHAVRVPLKPLAETLDLSRIVQFWIVVEQSPGGELRIDDVRLVKGEPGGELPVLEDKSPAGETYGKMVKDLSVIVPPEAKHNVRVVAGEVNPPPPEPGKDPRRFTRPGKIELFGLFEGPKGYTRRVYPHGLEFFDDKSAVIRYPVADTAFTIDAGATWKPLPAPFGGVNAWRSEVSGDRGDFLFVGMGQCCGGGSPSSFYFLRIVHGADGWKPGPAHPVDRDVRHCQDHYDVLRLDSGRIWAAWNHLTRADGYVVWARYSDDDGATWKPGGETPLVPGSANCGLGTDPYLFPFGEGAGCLWQDNERRVFFAAHDGKAWSQAAPVNARQMLNAASADAKTIYAVVGGGREGPVRILKGDGKAWSEDLRPGGEGCLTVQRKSGRLHYVYPESVEGRSHVMMITCDGGKWGAPREVFRPGEQHAGSDRLIVSLARWSPEEFVPVAATGLRGKESWKDVTWIQVFKVPVE
ncbi:MAG: sialidase family protein [Planctomycetota bacterium]